MKRKQNIDEEPSEVHQDPTSEIPKNTEEVRAQYLLRGDPEKMTEKLAKLTSKTAELAERGTHQGDFNRAITKATALMEVYRVSPAVWQGKPIKGHVDTLKGPMAFGQLEDHIQKEYGGGKYYVGVTDESSTDADVRAGRYLEISGSPIVRKDPLDDDTPIIPPQENLIDGRPARLWNRSGIPHDDDDGEDIAEQVIKKAVKRKNMVLGLKAVEQMVGEIDGKKPDNSVDVRRFEDMIRAERERSERQVADLKTIIERQSDEARRQREESEKRLLETERRREIEELKATFEKRIDQMQMQKNPNDLDAEKRVHDLQLKLVEQQNQFQLKLQESQAKFSAEIATLKAIPHDNGMKEALLALQQNTNQIVQGQSTLVSNVLQNAMAMGNKKDDSLDQMEKMMSVMGAMREFWGFGEANAEPKTFIDRLGGILENVLPTVIPVLANRLETGGTLSKEEIHAQAKRISEMAAAEASRQVEALKASGRLPIGYKGPVVQTPQEEVLQEQQRRYLLEQQATQQRAVAEQARVAAAKVVTPQEPTILSMVRPSPSSTAEVQAQPVQRAQPVQPQKPEAQPLGRMTIEEDRRRRVDAVLSILANEIRIRPRRMMWVEQAWDILPHDILQAILAAETDIQLKNVVEPIGSPAILNDIWGVVRIETAARDFIVDGLNVLRQLYNDEIERNTSEVNSGTNA